METIVSVVGLIGNVVTAVCIVLTIIAIRHDTKKRK